MMQKKNTVYNFHTGHVIKLFSLCLWEMPEMLWEISIFTYSVKFYWMLNYKQDTGLDIVESHFLKPPTLCLLSFSKTHYNLTDIHTNPHSLSPVSKQEAFVVGCKWRPILLQPLWKGTISSLSFGSGLTSRPALLPRMGQKWGCVVPSLGSMGLKSLPWLSWPG